MLKFWKPGVVARESARAGTLESLSERLEAAGEAGAFPGLPEADLVRLFNAAACIRLETGDRLFARGDPADRLYILIAGRIARRREDDAEEQIAGPGDWICDLDLLAPSLHDTTAVALSTTILLVVEPVLLETLEQPLRLYLTQRMQQVVLVRAHTAESRARALAARNAQLLAALFASRSAHGPGFAQSPAAQQLFAKVPALPVSTISLLHRMLDERTTKSEIVELVTMDPALTGTLLKAANSPYYGFRYKVTNVSHAIVLLGHNTVYQIIMSESVRRSLPGTPAFADIHRRAVEVSRLAFVYAQAINAPKPAEVATVGILGDIGLVVVELLKTCNVPLAPLFDLLDAADMGAALLRSWGLPQTLCDSLRFQHFPEFAPPERVPEEVRTPVTLLYLARRCYHRLHETGSGPAALFVGDYLDQIGHWQRSEADFFLDRVLPRLRAQKRLLPRSLAECLAF